MSQAVLRIVQAPNKWLCQNGHTIEASQQCAKLGSQVLCLDCLRRALPIPEPRPLTKAQRLTREAQYLAWNDIADLTHFVEGDDDLLAEAVERNIDLIQNELGLRNIPYHGQAHNLFTGINSRQLDTMLAVFTEFHQSIKR